jgi:hypothetical protein
MKETDKKNVLYKERGGFEPPIPKNGIIAFEATAFDHSAISPKKFLKIFTELF